MRPPGAITNLEQVTDFGRPAPPFQYRALDDFFNNYQSPNVWRASASYVTGAHNMKFGYQGAYLIEEIEGYADDPQLTYTFFGGVPVSLTQRIAPWDISNRTMYSAFLCPGSMDVGKRLTLQGAVRYDRAWSWFPADHNGAPVANLWSGPISFPRSGRRQCLQRHHAANGHGVRPVRERQDVVQGEPGRMLLQNASNQENYTISNPTLDGRNGRRGPTFQVAPDPKLVGCERQFRSPTAICTNQAANGECGAGSPNFANPLALTQFNPDVLKGWGSGHTIGSSALRFSRRSCTRTSIEVGYSRRWFGNFFVYDNQLIGPNDFQPITVTAPNIATLPNGGGFPVDYNMLKPGTPTTVQDLYTFANDYGDYNVHWQGVDVTLNARLKNGFVFQGGTSTGRGVTDFCQVAAQVPNCFNRRWSTRR